VSSTHLGPCGSSGCFLCHQQFDNQSDVVKVFFSNIYPMPINEDSVQFTNINNNNSHDNNIFTNANKTKLLKSKSNFVFISCCRCNESITYVSGAIYGYVPRFVCT
jgi:hypothetical protein